MTTIVVSRSMMAADSLVNDCGTRMCANKIKRVRGDLIGYCGEMSQGLQFMRLYGGNVKEMEELAFDDEFSAIVLTKAGRIVVYEARLEPIEVRDKFYAIGSVQAAALGAMHMGADPIEAVKIASKVDIYTGGRVKSLALSL